MIRRLFVGLVIGALLGAIVAAGLIKGLGIVTFGMLFALLAAAVTGTLVGLVAGKPIWATNAKIEAGLKAGAGALLAMLGVFLVRKFLGTSVDLTSFGAGAGALGVLPATSLPLVGAVLGAFFELDNTPAPEAKKGAAAPKARADGKVRVESASEDDELEAEAGSKRAKR